MDDFNINNNSTMNNKPQTSSYPSVIIKNKKHSNGFLKGIAFLIAALLICTAGSIGGAAVTLYVLPNTKLFKSTPLYKTIASNVSSQTVQTTPIVSSNTTPSSSSGLSVTDIAKKVVPAVVTVTTKSQSSGFFGSSSEGTGSGIIIRKDGYILTNYHVIEGSNSIAVKFSNNKTSAAKVVNYDQSKDLAVIKITDSSIAVPAVATLGSSSTVQVGDTVVAIGNPLGEQLAGTVTTGIISALNRKVQTENGTYATYLQTSAQISPGNSGGALVNTKGEVIGINAAKMSGDNVEGIGFAIPIDIAKTEINSLLKPLIMLGISIRDVDSSIAKQYNIPQGVLVEEVEDFSSAQKAGIQAGDIITKFDGKRVTTGDELNKYKSQHNAGDTVQVEVVRDKETKTLSIKLSN